MFPEDTVGPSPAQQDVDGWLITPNRQERYRKQFEALEKNEAGEATGNSVKGVLVGTSLPRETLGKIWEHADFEKSGALDIDEFMVAMYLADEAANGHPVPDQLPDMLIPPARREVSTSSNPFA